MRVLIIVNAVFGYDGISNVVTNYYIYQEHKNVRMDFVTINPIPEKLKIELENNGDKHFVLGYRNRNPFKYIKELSLIVKENNYDIVHVHGNSATMIVELLAAKIGGSRVRIAHSHNTRCNHPVINRILMPLFSVSYTHCCACSKEAGKFLFGTKECKIVNNGLDIELYSFNMDLRNQIRKKLNLENKYIIGHIGRFAFQKNQEFLIELMPFIVQLCPNAVLLLIGEGELEEKLKRKAVALGVANAILFYGTSNEIYKLVQAMDVFAFPSRFEGLGIVAIEAQAAGIPCILSEQVPHLVQVNKEVEFISLENSTKWINSILSYKGFETKRISSVNAISNNIKATHFNIKENCRDMYKFYFNAIS